MNGHHHEELARCLFEEANDAFLIFDLDNYRVMDVNPATQRLSGFRKKQLLDMKLQDLFGTSVEGAIEKMLAAFQTTGLFHSQEDYLLQCRNGKSLPINVSVNRIHTQPEPLGLVTVRDISERKKTEKILWSLARGTSTVVGTNFFPTLVQNIAESFGVCYAVYAQHLDFPVTHVRTLAFWAGDKLIENVEYPLEGTPCKETAAGSTTFFPRNVAQLFPDDHYLVEMSAESYCGIPLKDSSGRIMGHLAVLDTKAMEENLCDTPAFRVFAARAAAELERQAMKDRAQQLQNQLEHICRVSSMGEMASTLAHEINQPLGAIANNAQACLRGAQNGFLNSDEIIKALKEITSESIRAGEIIRRLRGFVSRKKPKKSTVQINDLIHEVIGLIDFDARNHQVNLHLELKEDLPNIQVDRIQIQQVLINLLRNGIEALEGKPAENRRVTISTSLDADEITISVIDTGKGISADEVESVFTPYVTTKPEGLGMGLSICRSIIEWHEGRISGKPGSESGMIFEFTLPVS